MTTSQNANYPYLWVTSNDRIHCLKMRINAQTLSTQYIASSYRPYNTYSSFSNLLNTMTTDNFNDIYTIEAWNYQYGIRTYLPFADIYNDTLFDYCNSGSDEMRLKAVFTNDCWLQFTAERRKNDGNWESVKIKKVNGQEVNDYLATIYRIAGSTEIWNDNPFTLQLELPYSDYLIGGRVKLHMRITPDNQNPYATENDFVHKDYEVNVSRNCGPKPGGCPYVYVNDFNDNYTVDNNILHRSEFQEYSGQDILDRYKLNVEPVISNNAIQIAIAENEDDNSTFDEAKLYYVDHPSGTKIGVTESNDIVVYDPSEVISTDWAALNDNNITSLIQYSTQLGTSGYIDDSIIAHYPSSLVSLMNQRKTSKNKIYQQKSVKQNNIVFDNDKDQTKATKKDKKLAETKPSKTNALLLDESDSVAVIAYVGNLDDLNPVSAKTWAGNLFASNYSGGIITTKFARREKLSEVIIPIFNIETSVETVKVNWLSDLNIKYLSIVPVHYNLYSMNEIPLQEAYLINQSGQIDETTQLQSIDQNYVNMDMNSYISLKFNTINISKVPTGYVRDYIFETVGQYSSGGKNLPLKVVNQQIPLTNKLYNNYPNPFNPITTIKYDIAKNANVKITIYNILGQQVKLLVDEFKKAGSYDVKFDATNLASGVYFYRIEAGSFIEAKKMVLLK
jgi:hypothetical protein